MNAAKPRTCSDSQAVEPGGRRQRWLQLTVVPADLPEAIDSERDSTLNVPAQEGLTLVRSQGALWITQGRERRRSGPAPHTQVQPIGDASICLMRIDHTSGPGPAPRT